MESQYLEQLQRIKRWLRRLEDKHPVLLTHYDEMVEYEDILWAFFQNCWHLKDWIRNDISIPEAVRNSVEEEIKAFENIMICADIANATKHLTRDKKKYKPQAGADRSVEIDVSVAAYTVVDSVYHYRINVQGGESVTKKATHEAINVARKSVGEWQSYLKSKGLL
jgi:hypothetical protein